MPILLGRQSAPSGGGGGAGLTPGQEAKLNSIQFGATANQTDAHLKDRANHTGTQPKSTIDGLLEALGEKVDKAAGKGLSDTNYTQAEKDKLAGLESSRFKGQFTSVAALNAALPTGEAGDYANVDLGAGSDVVRYIWDTSDEIWVEQLGVSSQLTGAQIKQEYEAQPDTNAFTDAEKDKLGTVDENANNYQHPETHPASMIQQDPDHRFVTDAEKEAWNNPPPSAGGIEEAPKDGRPYARKNASWVEVEAGSSTPLVAIEFTDLPTQVKELGDWVIEVEAEALLQGQSIVEFVANWSDGTTSTVPATAGAATLTKAAPAYPGTLSVEVYAVDSLTNRSLTISATVEVLENQPPVGPITINHATSTSPSGTVDVALSGATDPDGDTAALRYEIVDAGGLTFSKTTDIEAGEIIQATAPADEIEAIYTFSVRAYDDFGAVTAVYSSSLDVILSQAIGVKLVSTGGDGGTWAHIDGSGNEIASPAASWFNAHPVWGGIVDQIIDGQHMVKIPKFYYKRGTAGGSPAWWISDQPADGFAVFPAFVLNGAEVDQFWYGKYQASASGGKLQSVPGVLPQVSTSLTDFLSLATARNVGGVEGFRLHHYDMWLAIQWLYLIENATMDSQAKTGQGRVSQSSAAAVDAADVAQATYRGMVGLWGNVAQWMDGVRTLNDVIERRGYTGGWTSTGQAVPNGGSPHYPLTFRPSASDELIADTFLTSNTAATLPDYVRWRNSGEWYPRVGGHWSSAAHAGLWYVNCSIDASNTSTSIGARLARVV